MDPVQEEKELAIKNILDGWYQITTGNVQEGDMLWSSNSKYFELEDSSSVHVGKPVNDKLCTIRKEEKGIKIRFKSLKKVLKENPELALTEAGALATDGQIRVGIVVTLNSVWTSNLGKDYVFSDRLLLDTLLPFVEREYDDIHMLTWDRIDKTKESWLTVRDLLDDKDYKGTGIQLEQLRDHIAVIISKLHHYDRNAANNDKGIEARDKLLEKKNKEIDSLECTLSFSKKKYEETIKDLRGQLGSLEIDSREAIMKRKFTRIAKRQ